MPKDTKTLGNNKARACESLGFVHKKRLCQRFDTTSFLFYLFSYSLYRCLSTHIASISIQPVRCDVNPTLSSSAGAFLQRPLYNIVF